MDLHDKLRFGGQYLRIPFVVRHEVERLLSLGAINRNELIDDCFWEQLGELCTVSALHVLDFLHSLAKEQHDYRIHVMRALEYAIQVVLEPKVFLKETSEYKQNIKTESSLSANASFSTKLASIKEPSVLASIRTVLKDEEKIQKKSDHQLVPIRRVMVSHQHSLDLYAQVRHWLHYGIEVAGEKFVFLAFSTSQLREHGCWFTTRIQLDPL